MTKNILCVLDNIRKCDFSVLYTKKKNNLWNEIVLIFLVFCFVVSFPFVNKTESFIVKREFYYKLD